MKNDFDVFISYRRDGGIHLARLLHDKLEQRGFRLFLDMENMRAGKFNEQLFTYIENCPSFLLVLTAVGGSYKREDGVYVAPINLLRP